MLLPRLKIIFFVLLLSKALLAEEGKEPAKEAPAATAKKEISYSGAQTDEWSKAQKDVQAAKIKYDNDVKALDDLKIAAKSQENLSKESLAKINEAQKTVEKSKQNYLRLLNQYNLRFPEKGLDVGRKYERSGSERDGIETVEEKPQGVEAKLRRLNLNIKRQYLSNTNEQNSRLKMKKKSGKKLPIKQSSDESGMDEGKAPDDDVTRKIIIEK